MHISSYTCTVTIYSIQLFYVGFAVDKLVLGLVLQQAIRFSPAIISPFLRFAIAVV